MPLELMNLDDKGGSGNKSAVPGARGFMILAQFRKNKNGGKVPLTRLRSFAHVYCKENFPESLEEKSNGEEPSKKKEEDATKDSETETASQPDTDLIFGPYEMMDESRCFILSNLADPSHYAHYMFSKMADDHDWSEPNVPLRIMPVQEICTLNPRVVERALKPVLEKVFAGEESIRFSVTFFGKQNDDGKNLSRAQVKSIVRSIIWATNPNCVQCIKYQDYAILLELFEPYLFMGVAKEFNQLGRYNTSTVHRGRDLKEMMEDSEDDISDDPELSEWDNKKKKMRIKKKRKAEREEQEKNTKQVKCEDGDENPDNSELNTDDKEIQRSENGVEDINDK